jgi:hypothetical protein
VVTSFFPGINSLLPGPGSDKLEQSPEFLDRILLAANVDKGLIYMVGMWRRL